MFPKDTKEKIKKKKKLIVKFLLTQNSKAENCQEVSKKIIWRCHYFYFILNVFKKWHHGIKGKYILS